MSMSIRELATAHLDQKIAAGEALESAINAETAADEALKDARKAAAAARRDALAAGWTERELKKLGLFPTATRTRTAKPRQAAANSAPNEHAEQAQQLDSDAGRAAFADA